MLGLADDAMVLSWLATRLVEETEQFLEWERAQGMPPQWRWRRVGCRVGTRVGRTPGALPGRAPARPPRRSAGTSSSDPPARRHGADGARP